METFSALLAICARNSLVPGEFPTRRPVTRSFDVFFDLRLNKRLSKQSWGWWFQMPSCSLWRHSNVLELCLIWIRKCLKFNFKYNVKQISIPWLISPLSLHSLNREYNTEYNACTKVALTRGLFWCLFPELHHNSGNKHQNNTRVSTETIHHEWIYSIVFLTWNTGPMNDNQNTIFTHQPWVWVTSCLRSPDDFTTDYRGKMIVARACYKWYLTH